MKINPIKVIEEIPENKKGKKRLILLKMTLRSEALLWKRVKKIIHEHERKSERGKLQASMVWCRIESRLFKGIDTPTITPIFILGPWIVYDLLQRKREVVWNPERGWTIFCEDIE